jgi:hypothetical protein
MPSARPLALLLSTLALTLATTTPAVAGVFPGDPVVGPSPALRTLDGLDLAPDGGGALVATIQDGGVDHVFASRLVDGAWGAPERLDVGLGAPSAQPAVAAEDDGRLAVAFVNAGNLYVASRTSRSAPWVRQTLWDHGGASSPALDMSVNGKAYLVFTAPGAGGHDVRLAYARDGGPWTLAAAPLDAVPSADAGFGTARPQIAASADGIAIAVWGERGHVFARRVRGTQPSVTFADASAGLGVEGVGATTSDSPVVAAQDDDSFTAVAFRASFTVGGASRSRVVYRRLRGSRFEGATPLDILPFASGQGSVGPHVAIVGTGQGLALGSGDGTFLSYAMQIRVDAGPGPVVQVDSVSASTAPTYASIAAATARKMLVAWQLTPASGSGELHARYWADTAFQPELVLSKPQYGPVLGTRGLLSAGDDAGDLAVAYVQDVPGRGPAIAVATIDQPPARFAVKRVTRFQRTDRPVLAWTVSREAWGRYFRVTLDGVQVGITGRRSFRPRTPLAQGAHSWQVTALDRRGQSYAAPGSVVRVDTVPATVTAHVSGKLRAGALLRLAVNATDALPTTASGVAPVATSGVKSIAVDWGDHTTEQIRHGARHTYLKPGRYKVRIVVLDRAGNRTTTVQRLKIVKPPKRHKGNAHGHAARAQRAR